MKRAINAVLSLVTLVALVCVERAIVQDASIAPTASIQAQPAVDPKAANRLAAAIRIPTVTEFGKPPNFVELRKMHALLQASFPRAHAKLVREVIDSGTLVYTWRGSDTTLAPVLLMGHMDVVPVEPGTEKDWTHPAFSGDIADGEVWGRGAMDDKVNVMGLMEATEALLADGFQPKRTVIFEFGHAEEGGPAAAAKTAALFEKRGIRPWFVLDEGGAITQGQVPGVSGPVGLIGVAEKGYLTIRLTAHGEGGHSSMPPMETAVSIIGDAVAEVQEARLPARLDGATRGMLAGLTPYMEFKQRLVMANLWLTKPLVTRMMSLNRTSSALVRTTTAATMVSGGVKDNVVPQTASAIVNFRLLPGDSVKWVLQRVKDAIDDERVTVEVVTGVEATRVSPDDTEPYRLIVAAIRETLGARVVAPYLVVGGTDSRNFERVSPNVYRFAPIITADDALSRVHGTNERIDVDYYLAAVTFYRRLIENSAR